PHPTSPLFPYTTLFRSSLIGDRDGMVVNDAVDLHVHAQTGTEDPFEIAKAATLAHMSAVVFKNLPGRNRAETRRAVAEQVNRWRSEEHTSELQSPDHLV